MTRQFVYGIALWVYLATIAMTIAAICIPEWISWDAYPDKTRTFFPAISALRGPAKPVHYTYGLHSRCDSISETCTPFPRYEDCQGPNRKFCSLWRTTGFLMSVAVVVELAGIVGFAIAIIGGKQKREQGWRIIFLLIAVCVACQCTAMGIVSGLHEHDEHFSLGWYLAKSFKLTTVSWTLQVAVAVGLAASALLLPEEGGYELIPDRA